MNVLVPFTIAPVSERAVRTTLDLFGDREDVHIIAAHITTREKTAAQIAASEIESLGSEADATVEAEIKTISKRSLSKPVIRAAIIELVETADIDLVVLGYESKPLFDRVLESDTTGRLLQSHEIPVLLVP